MQAIDVLEFSAGCGALIDRVAATSEAVCITRNGQSIAELHCVGTERPKSPFGLQKGTAVVLADIISPIDADWETK